MSNMISIAIPEWMKEYLLDHLKSLRRLDESGLALGDREAADIYRERVYGYNLVISQLEKQTEFPAQETPDPYEDWEQTSEDGWLQHPFFTMAQWNEEAGRGDTRLGYREWVESQIEIHMSENEHPSGAPLIEETFTIDDQNTLTGYHNPDPAYLWNGWETPVFEKDELLRWLELECPGQGARYSKNLDAIYCPEQGNDPDHQWAMGRGYNTVDGVKVLYAPDGWTWDLYEPPDEPLCPVCNSGVVKGTEGTQMMCGRWVHYGCREKHKRWCGVCNPPLKG